MPARFRPTITPPDAALLDRIEELIKNGYPGVTRTGEAWGLAGEEAPPNHFFMPQGMTFARYVMPQRITGNALILGYEQPPEKKHPIDSRYWFLKPVIDISYERGFDFRVVNDRMKELVNLLTADLGVLATGQILRAAERLCSPRIQVFSVRDVVLDMLPGASASGPASRLTFTVFCSGRAA